LKALNSPISANRESLLKADALSAVQMSEIEYNNLLFEISERLNELNAQERLLFLCRGKLATGSEDNIQDVLSLFKELEERNHLGPNRLGVIKDLLKGVKEWDLFGKIKTFESKRKEYISLLEQIIPVLDGLSDLERLISLCRVEIPEANESNIDDVRSLFKVLENHSCLGINCLGMLKEILTQTEQTDLLKEGDIGVCGIAVMANFSCGISVILI